MRKKRKEKASALFLKIISTYMPKLIRWGLTCHNKSSKERTRKEEYAEGRCSTKSKAFNTLI